MNLLMCLAPLIALSWFIGQTGPRFRGIGASRAPLIALILLGGILLIRFAMLHFMSRLEIRLTNEEDGQGEVTSFASCSVSPNTITARPDWRPHKEMSIGIPMGGGMLSRAELPLRHF